MLILVLTEEITMMNSRQIVDLIRKESQKETDEKIVSAYSRLK